MDTDNFIVQIKTKDVYKDCKRWWEKIWYFKLWSSHCTKSDVFHWGFLQLMWPNPQKITDLVTSAEEVLSRKLHFLFNGKQTKWLDLD